MALLVFTFLIWVCRKVRGRYMLIASILLTLVASFIGGTSVQAGPLWSWKRLAMYFSSYCIGLYGRQLVLRFASRIRWYWAVLLVVLLFVMERGYQHITNEFASACANIFLIGYGLIAGVAVAVAFDGTHIGLSLIHI